MVFFFLRLPDTYRLAIDVSCRRPVALGVRARRSDHAASDRQHLVLCVRGCALDGRRLSLLSNLLQVTCCPSVGPALLFCRLCDRHHARIAAVTAHRGEVTRDLDCLHKLVRS